MLVLALLAAFLVVIGLMVVRRRHVSTLASLACLIGALLVFVLLQDFDLLRNPAVQPDPTLSQLGTRP